MVSRFPSLGSSRVTKLFLAKCKELSFRDTITKHDISDITIMAI